MTTLTTLDHRESCLMNLTSGGASERRDASQAPAYALRARSRRGASRGGGNAAARESLFGSPRGEALRIRPDGTQFLTSSASADTPIVFVVDDDISVRDSLELLIQASGWQPETFASAKDFLVRPRALAPSCLILDVALPDVNGLDLQKRVAADRPDTPVIFITGYGDVPI